MTEYWTNLWIFLVGTAFLVILVLFACYIGSLIGNWNQRKCAHWRGVKLEQSQKWLASLREAGITEISGGLWNSVFRD